MAGLHSPPMNNPSGTDSSNAFSDASDIDNLLGSAETYAQLEPISPGVAI
jgi:hypothetical protein